MRHLDGAVQGLVLSCFGALELLFYAIVSPPTRKIMIRSGVFLNDWRSYSKRHRSGAFRFRYKEIFFVLQLIMSKDWEFNSEWNKPSSLKTNGVQPKVVLSNSKLHTLYTEVYQKKITGKLRYNDLNLNYDHCRYPQIFSREIWACTCPEPLTKVGDDCVCEDCLFQVNNDTYGEEKAEKLSEKLIEFLTELEEDNEEGSSSDNGVSNRIFMEYDVTKKPDKELQNNVIYRSLNNRRRHYKSRRRIESRFKKKLDRRIKHLFMRSRSSRKGKRRCNREAKMDDETARAAPYYPYMGLKFSKIIVPSKESSILFLFKNRRINSNSFPSKGIGNRNNQEKPPLLPYAKPVPRRPRPRKIDYRFAKIFMLKRKRYPFYGFGGFNFPQFQPPPPPPVLAPYPIYSAPHSPPSAMNAPVNRPKNVESPKTQSVAVSSAASDNTLPQKIPEKETENSISAAATVSDDSNVQPSVVGAAASVSEDSSESPADVAVVEPSALEHDEIIIEAVEAVPVVVVSISAEENLEEKPAESPSLEVVTLEEEKPFLETTVDSISNEQSDQMAVASAASDATLPDEQPEVAADSADDAEDHVPETATVSEATVEAISLDSEEPGSESLPVVVVVDVSSEGSSADKEDATEAEAEAEAEAVAVAVENAVELATSSAVFDENPVVAVAVSSSGESEEDPIQSEATGDTTAVVVSEGTPEETSSDVVAVLNVPDSAAETLAEYVVGSGADSGAVEVVAVPELELNENNAPDVAVGNAIAETVSDTEVIDIAPLNLSENEVSDVTLEPSTSSDSNSVVAVQEESPSEDYDVSDYLPVVVISVAPSKTTGENAAHSAAAAVGDATASAESSSEGSKKPDNDSKPEAAVAVAVSADTNENTDESLSSAASTGEASATAQSPANVEESVVSSIPAAVAVSTAEDEKESPVVSKTPEAVAADVTSSAEDSEESEEETVAEDAIAVAVLTPSENDDSIAESFAVSTASATADQSKEPEQPLVESATAAGESSSPGSDAEIIGTKPVVAVAAAEGDVPQTAAVGDAAAVVESAASESEPTESEPVSISVSSTDNDDNLEASTVSNGVAVAVSSSDSSPEGSVVVVSTDPSPEEEAVSVEAEVVESRPLELNESEPDLSSVEAVVIAETSENPTPVIEDLSVEAVVTLVNPSILETTNLVEEASTETSAVAAAAETISNLVDDYIVPAGTSATEPVKPIQESNEVAVSVSDSTASISTSTGNVAVSVADSIPAESGESEEESADAVTSEEADNSVEEPDVQNPKVAVAVILPSVPEQTSISVVGNAIEDNPPSPGDIAMTEPPKLASASSAADDTNQNVAENLIETAPSLTDSELQNMEMETVAVAAASADENVIDSDASLISEPAEAVSFSDSVIAGKTKGTLEIDGEKSFGSLSSTKGTGSLSLGSGGGSAGAAALTGKGYSAMGVESEGAKSFGIGIVGKKASYKASSTSSLLAGEGDAIGAISAGKEGAASATAVATKKTASAGSAAFGKASASASATPGKTAAGGSATYGENLQTIATVKGKQGPIAETVSVGSDNDTIQYLAELPETDNDVDDHEVLQLQDEQIIPKSNLGKEEVEDIFEWMQN